jgi:protein-tyrosine phosphatase
MELKPKGRNDSHQFDYSQIMDNIYIGSDLCKGGICLMHGEEFKKLGVSVEINLSLENNELPPKDIETYLWLPVTDGHAPSQHQLEAGICLMDTMVNAGKKIYVHCRNGHGRSPTLVAAYLMRYKNMSLEEANKLICKNRPEAHIEKLQEEALREFAKQ